MRTSAHNPRRTEITSVAALALGALFLRLVALAHQAIWVDEAFTLAYAGVFDTMYLRRLLLNLNGPFYALLLHYWSTCLGTGEWALRSLSAFLGAAAIPALYWALKPLGRPRVAWTACLLLALSPFHVWYSQEIRSYVLLMLMAVISTGAFLRLDEGRIRNWVLYAAAGILGLLSNLSCAFLIAAQGAAVMARGRTGRPLHRGLLISWALIAVALSPWMVEFYHRRVVPSGALELQPVREEERLRGVTTAPALGIPYTYAAFALGFSYGPSLREYHTIEQRGAAEVLRPYLPQMIWAAVAFGTAAFLGVIRLWRSGPAGKAWVWVLVLPVLLTFATASRNLKVMNPRYAAAAMPAFALVVAQGILAPRRQWARFLLGAAVLAPTGLSLAQHFTEPRYSKEDARGIAAFLHLHAGEDDLVFLVGTDRPFRNYYWRRPGMELRAGSLADAWHWVQLDGQQQRERFEEAAGEHERVFVVFLRPKDVDPHGRWRQYLEERNPGAEVAHFTGSEVWILDQVRPSQGSSRNAVRSHRGEEAAAPGTP